MSQGASVRLQQSLLTQPSQAANMDQNLAIWPLVAVAQTASRTSKPGCFLSSSTVSLADTTVPLEEGLGADKCPFTPEVLDLRVGFILRTGGPVVYY